MFFLFCELIQIESKNDVHLTSRIADQECLDAKSLKNFFNMISFQMGIGGKQRDITATQYFISSPNCLFYVLLQ